MRKLLLFVGVVLLALTGCSAAHSAAPTDEFVNALEHSQTYFAPGASMSETDKAKITEALKRTPDLHVVALADTSTDDPAKLADRLARSSGIKGIFLVIKNNQYEGIGNIGMPLPTYVPPSAQTKSVATQITDYADFYRQTLMQAPSRVTPWRQAVITDHETTDSKVMGIVFGILIVGGLLGPIIGRQVADRRAEKKSKQSATK